MPVELFLISALRAILEMLLLALLAQGVLFLLSGRARDSNPIYQLFSVITRGPLYLVSRLLPGHPAGTTIAVVTFVILAIAWLGLAMLRKSL